MSEFVALKELWKHPEWLGNNISLPNCYVDYSPDVEYVISDIGGKRKYPIARKDVGWKVWCSEQEETKIYVIPDRPIHGVAFFKNMKGWIGVNELITNLAKAASCLRLKGKGRLLTFEIYDSMPKEWQDKISENCWIFKESEANIEHDSDVTWYRHGQLENASMYVCANGVSCIPKSFYPIAELPSDVLVKIGSKSRNGRTVEKSLRLRLP